MTGLSSSRLYGTEQPTANTLREQLLTASSVTVSDQTIWNRPREVTLRSRRPAVRPVVTPAHRAARLAWVWRHPTGTRQQGPEFSSPLSPALADGFGMAESGWRRQGKRYHAATVRDREPFGGGSILVWRDLQSTLHRVQGNLTGLVYRDANARPHRARVVTTFLQLQVTRRD